MRDITKIHVNPITLLFIATIFVVITIADLSLDFPILTRAAQPSTNSPGSLIFRSDDQGRNWVAVGSLPNVVELVADPVESGTIYAITRIGLYKSSDSGTMWSKIGNGLPAGSILKLVFDPQNSSTLYTTAPISDSSVGIFKSTDGGINWTRTAATSFSASLFIAPSDPATIYAVGDSWFKSTDGGASWNSINRPSYGAHGSTHFFRIIGFAVAPSDAMRLYVATLGAGNAPIPGTIHRSVDGGASWRGSSVFTSTLLAIDPSDPNVVYVKSILSTFGGINKTVNGGDSWTQIDKETPGLFSILSLIVNPKNSSHLYAPFGNNFSTSTPKGGIYKSENGGESWSLLSTGNGLPNAGITSITVDASSSSRLYAATVPGITNVSAASYNSLVAPASIATLFGTNLTAGTDQANSIPLPFSLAGAAIKVRDVKGFERDAPLFYASPMQINFQVPEETAPGVATLSVVRNQEVIAAEGITVPKVAPGLFSVQMDGQGIAAAVVQRFKADGTQSYEAVSRFDSALGKHVTIPIDLDDASDQVFLAIFGTGIRFRSSESAVQVKLGDVALPVLYAGAQPNFIGVDQVNVRLTRDLVGKGDADIMLVADDMRANKVRVHIK